MLSDYFSKQSKRSSINWKEADSEFGKLTGRIPAFDDPLDEAIQNQLKKRLVVNLENTPLYPGIDHLLWTPNIKYLNLSNNSANLTLLDLERIPVLNGLVKLDISGNALTHIPNQLFFERFPQLRILYLHANFLKDDSFVQYLSVLHSLIYITIFNNPLPRKLVREKLINLLPQLEAIDFLAVLDWEKNFAVSSLYLESQIGKAEIKWPIVAPNPEANTDEKGIIKGIYQEITHIHRVYSKSNVIVRVQKLIRGAIYRKRTAFTLLKGKKITRDTIVKIARAWKERARLQVVMKRELEERGKLDYYYIGSNGRARNVRKLVKQFVEKLLKHLEFNKSVRKLQKFLKASYGRIFSLYKDPLKLYNLKCYNSFLILEEHRERTLRLITEVLSRRPNILGGMDPEVLLKQINNSVEPCYDIRTIRWKPDINLKELPLVQLIRTPMQSLFRIYTPWKKGDYYIKNARRVKIKRKVTWHLTAKDKEKFTEKLGRLNSFLRTNYGQLVRISLPQTPILEFLLKHIFTHNMACNHEDSVYVYLDKQIHKVSAAIRIQTFYRRRLSLRHSPYKNIFNVLTRYRAAVLLQRWIRNFKFRCRMAFLSNVGYYMGQISGRSLYIEEDVYVNLIDIVQANLKRIHLIDQEVKAYVNPYTNTSIVVRKSRRDLPMRSFLPEWIDFLQYPVVVGTDNLVEGDVINLLHNGTKISRKARDNIKYFKVRFPKLEVARYIAGAIALMTFTLKNRGFFIRLLDKNKFKTQLDKYKDYYFAQVNKIYKVKVARYDSQAIEEYLGQKRRTNMFKHFNNCCFLFTSKQQNFKEAVEESGSKDYLMEIKVQSREGLDQQTYLDKNSKHLLRTYHDRPDTLYFITYPSFVKILKKEQESIFALLINHLKDKNSHKIEQTKHNNKQYKSIERDTMTDMKQLFVQEVTLRRSFYKAKDIVLTKQEREEIRKKFKESKEQELKVAQNKAFEQRQEMQEKKHSLDMAKGVYVRQKMKDTKREKREVTDQVRKMAGISEQNKRDHIRDMRQKEFNRKQSAQSAKDGTGFFSSINMLLAEENKEEMRRRKQVQLVEAKQKVESLREKRLEEKALGVILHELKKPKGDSFISEYDKSLVEQSVSMTVNKIDVSIDVNNERPMSIARTTNQRFRRLLERSSVHQGNNNDSLSQTYDILGTNDRQRTRSTVVKDRIIRDLSIGAYANVHPYPNKALHVTPDSHLNYSFSDVKKSMTRSKLPSIHGKLLEEFYPVAKIPSDDFSSDQ